MPPLLPTRIEFEQRQKRYQETQQQHQQKPYEDRETRYDAEVREAFVQFVVDRATDAVAQQRWTLPVSSLLRDFVVERKCDDNEVAPTDGLIAMCTLECKFAIPQLFHDELWIYWSSSIQDDLLLVTNTVIVEELKQAIAVELGSDAADPFVELEVIELDPNTSRIHPAIREDDDWAETIVCHRTLLRRIQAWLDAECRDWTLVATRVEFRE
jgi:hypothetical protein